MLCHVTRWHTEEYNRERRLKIIADREAAKKAKEEANEQELQGRPIYIDFAKARDEAPEEKKEEIETFVTNQDWDDVAISLWKKKDQWLYLDFFEQTKWRTDYFGLSPEKFKNVIWVDERNNWIRFRY